MDESSGINHKQADEPLHPVDAVKEYLSRFEHYDIKRISEDLKEGESIAIPTSQFEQVRYIKENSSWTTSRDINFYNGELFSDEYEEAEFLTEALSIFFKTPSRPL